MPLPQYSQSTWPDLLCYWKRPYQCRTSATSGTVRVILHQKKVQAGFTSAAAATPWPPSTVLQQWWHQKEKKSRGTPQDNVQEAYWILSCFRSQNNGSFRSHQVHKSQCLVLLHTVKKNTKSISGSCKEKYPRSIVIYTKDFSVKISTPQISDSNELKKRLYSSRKQLYDWYNVTWLVFELFFFQSGRRTHAPHANNLFAVEKRLHSSCKQLYDWYNVTWRDLFLKMFRGFFFSLDAGRTHRTQITCLLLKKGCIRLNLLTRC